MHKFVFKILRIFHVSINLGYSLKLLLVNSDIFPFCTNEIFIDIWDVDKRAPNRQEEK